MKLPLREDGQPDIDAIAEALADHADGVVIVTTRHEGSGTFLNAARKGNMHACLGAVADWLEDVLETRRLRIPKRLKENDDA